MLARMPGAFWTGAAERVETDEGSARMAIVAGSLLCNQVTGRLTLPMADRMRELGDAAIAATGRVWVFCDWSEMTSYESRCRAELTRWAVDQGDALKCISVYTNATIVRMGVSVASIFIERVVSHDDERSFREAFREAERLALRGE